MSVMYIYVSTRKTVAIQRCCMADLERKKTRWIASVELSNCMCMNPRELMNGMPREVYSVGGLWTPVVNRASSDIGRRHCC